jgi:hypothetical protein
LQNATLSMLRSLLNSKSVILSPFLESIQLHEIYSVRITIEALKRDINTSIVLSALRDRGFAVVRSGYSDNDVIIIVLVSLSKRRFRQHGRYPRIGTTNFGCIMALV